MSALRLTHTVIETIVGVLSIIFNVWLLYLIKYHSKFGSDFYRVMLATDALLDLALAVVVLLAQPICIIGDGYKLYFSDGFFAGRSHALDQLLLALWFLLELYNVMWVPVQFVYRYAFVCLSANSEHARRVLRRLALVTVAYAVIGTLFCFQVAHEEEPEGVRIIRKNGWPTEGFEPFVNGGHRARLRTQLWVLLWMVSSVGGAVVVVVFEIKIARGLRRMGKISHQRTQRMHAEFHRALLAMAICPIVTACIPLAFFCITLIIGANPGPSQVFLTMGVSAITLFNPITTTYFMHGYRDAVLTSLGLKRRSPVAPCDTRVTGLSVATAATAPL